MYWFRRRLGNVKRLPHKVLVCLLILQVSLPARFTCRVYRDDCTGVSLMEVSVGRIGGEDRNDERNAEKNAFEGHDQPAGGSACAGNCRPAFGAEPASGYFGFHAAGRGYGSGFQVALFRWQ